MSEVRVSVGDSTIEDLRFQVNVVASGSTNLQVNVDYAGKALLSRVDAILYEPALSCAQVTQRGHVHQAFGTGKALVGADRRVEPIVFSGLPEGARYTVVVRGYSDVNEDVEAALGCTEASGQSDVIDGLSRISVMLLNHVLRFRDAYNVHHEFSIDSTRYPGNVQRILNAFKYIGSDPGGFLVGCSSGANGCSRGGFGGVLEIYKDANVSDDFVSAIEEVLQDEALKSAFREVVNDAYEGWAGEMDVAEWAQDDVKLSALIDAALGTFYVNGKMWFPSSLDVGIADDAFVGRIPEKAADQVWDNVVFKWRGSCEKSEEACDGIVIPAREFGVGGGLVNGKFDGAVVNHDALQINEHTLTLNYGLALSFYCSKRPRNSTHNS